MRKNIRVDSLFANVALEPHTCPSQAGGPPHASSQATTSPQSRVSLSMAARKGNICLPGRTSRLGGEFTFLPIHILDVGPLVNENVEKLCTPYSKFY